MSRYTNITFENINDDLILKLYICKTGNINSNCMHYSWLQRHPEIAEYIQSRFSDKPDMSIPEIIYRINHQIESVPICPICGKYIPFINFSQGYANKCPDERCMLSINSQEENDTYVLNLMLNKKHQISVNCMRHEWIDSHPAIIDYIKCRFPDSSEITLQEILYRISHNISERPVCPVCGKLLDFISYSLGYRKFDSYTCQYKFEQQLLCDKHNIEESDKIGKILNDESPMTDEEALSIVLTKNTFRTRILKNPKLKYFMEHRYPDIPAEMFDYKEVVYRLINKIEIRPVCRVCGKPVKFAGNKYFLTCSKKCCYKDEERSRKFSESMANKTPEEKQATIEKREQTVMDRFGVKNTLIYFKDQIRETMIERHGGYTMQSPTLKAKVLQTVWEKYHCINVFQSEEVKQKSMETTMAKYSVPYHSQTEESRRSMSEKSKQIYKDLQNRLEDIYGVKSILAVPEYAEKRRQTMKENHTGRMSNEERHMMDLLTDIYGKNDVESQYFDKERYPFNCDFYIKSKDCFIEYNGSQYHNDHVYTGTESDLTEVQMLQEKGYFSNIDVWTVRDTAKIQKCQETCINMLWLYREWEKDWAYYCKTHSCFVKKKLKPTIRQKLQDLVDNTSGLKIIENPKSRIADGISHSNLNDNMDNINIQRI